MIYSFGYKADFSFEKEALEKTKCEVHVFDPTMAPSRMRQREQLLNGEGPKRITWHSIGVSDADDDNSKCVCCYGTVVHVDPQCALFSTEGNV